MTAVINAELNAGLEHNLVIVDRPVQDALSYLNAALASTGRRLMAVERDYLYGLAQLHVPRYIINFKTKLDNSIAIGEDCDQDRDFRTLVDLKISEVNDALSIDACPLTESEATLAIIKIL